MKPIKGALIGFIFAIPFWLAVLIPVAWGAAETIYVCQGGDGSSVNAGVCATAFDDSDVFVNGDNWDANVDTTNQKIGPGDTIYLMDDTAFSTQLVGRESGTSGHPITIMGDGDGDAEFNNCTTHCISIDNLVYFDIKDLKITGSGDSGIMRNDDGASWAALDECHVNITNVNISGCTDAGVHITGDYFTITDSVLTDNGDTSAWHNIYAIGDNITISKSSFTNSAAGCGIRAYGSNLEVSYNFISGNARRPLCPYTGATGETHQYMTYHHNIVQSAANDSFTSFGRSDDSVFSDVYMYNNVFYNATANAHGFSISNMTNFKFKNNILVCDDYALAFITAGDKTGAVVENNIYYNVDRWYDAGSERANLAAWQAATSFDDDSLLTDPLFVNAPTDMNLKPASPARNFGIYLSGYETALNPNASWPDDVLTIEDILNAGPYGSFRGAAGM